MRHSFMRIGGARLHWAEVGDGSNQPPVLLLHGLNDCHLTWRRVAPALGRSRRVLMPDLPGHGFSDRPDASYELGWYAHLMARWIDAVGLEQVDVVGHSLGGGIAQVLLLESPARIRRLVLAASGGLGREIALLLRLAALPRVVEHLGQPFMGPCTWLALRAVRNAVPAEHIAELSTINARKGSARAFARTVRDIIDWHGQRQTFFQRAHEITSLPPMAVFWGDRDTIIPAAHGRALVESVEGVRLTLFKDCGHYVHHEQPASFLRELRDFLDDPVVTPARLRGADAGSDGELLGRAEMRPHLGRR
jgi:pimeloyl-ACP methyl ester carboxylesterase